MQTLLESQVPVPAPVQQAHGMLLQVPVPAPVQQLNGVPAAVHEALLIPDIGAGPCPGPVHMAFWLLGLGGPKAAGGFAAAHAHE